MSRFAYQPISIEDSKYSKPGQMLVDTYNGHLYTNYNNIIVSATKRIEEKLEDIDQIYNNVLEQVDIVLSLEADYKYFINNTYTDASQYIMEVYSLDKEILVKYNYIKNGLSKKNKLLSAIRKYMNKLISANEYHENLNSTYKIQVDEINTNMSDFSTYVAQQNSDIQVLLSKLSIPSST